MLKKTILLLVIFLNSGVSMAQSRQAKEVQADVLDSIHKHAKTLLSDKRFRSVSIGVYLDGKPYSGHFGELTIGKDNPPDANTLYEIASVTKTMTGLVAAKAVVDGKLSLDTDINLYLPEPLLNLSPKSNPITVRQLLTHRSGIPQNLTDLASYVDTENVEPTLFLEALNHPKFERSIGTYQYSNIAPDLLAYVLETIYKQPFEDLLTQTLIEQAGMENSKMTLTKEDMVDFAFGYNERGKEMPAFTDRPKLWGAAGRIKSTLPDMLKYIALQLEPDNKIVAESQRTITEGISRGQMGYFWQKQSNRDGTFIQHHGGLYGTQNWLIIYPQYDLGISILSNVSFNGMGDILRDIADSIVDDVKPFGTKSLRLAIQGLCIQDVDGCIRLYHQLKKDDEASYSFGDANQLNTLGYRLLGMGKVNEAIKILKLQTLEYPGLSNAYDSLAEAYYMNKAYPKSLINYRKSFSLDPSNSHAKTQIQSINEKMKTL